MRKLYKIYTIGFCLSAIYSGLLSAQGQDSLWSVDECIDYALQQNISIRKSSLSHETDLINFEQAKASRFPSISASAAQSYTWSRGLDSIGGYGDYSGNDGTSFGVNSSVRLYNGFKAENTIKKTELYYDASQYNIDVIKESISLSVLDAYLQVLYAEEQVKNTEKQIESTTGQLKLAEERINLGAISKSDYLLVKSELATENYTLANAQNLLTTNLVNLLQLMELRINNNFRIKHPDFQENFSSIGSINTDSIYNVALTIKPQIKSSEINEQIADLDIAIAGAAYQPSLSLNGGISTGYTSENDLPFSDQVRNRVNPNISLSLSVPIYQNRQAKSEVALARIGSHNASLETLNVKNQLRKEVEQACANVLSAEKKFEASREQYYAIEEAYIVATEKYNVGLLNSVDYIIRKTSMINAESELLQSKYNLVFSYKILDFYTGKPLTF